MLESFALSPDGRTIAAVFDSTTSSRVELLDTRASPLRWAPKLPRGQLLTRARCGGPTAARWRSRSGRCEHSATSFPSMPGTAPSNDGPAVILARSIRTHCRSPKS